MISEVHYHPLPAATETDFDQDDFEFVQVMNIGYETVNLGGVAFVKPDTVPNPGQFPHYTTVTEAGTDYFAISYRRDPCAVGITPIIEVRTDLKEWKNGEAEGVIILVGITSDADGIPRHTYRFTNALVGDPSSRHVRLRVPAP